MSGQEAKDWCAALANANGLSRFVKGDHKYEVTVRFQLPDERWSAPSRPSEPRLIATGAAARGCAAQDASVQYAARAATRVDVSREGTESDAEPRDKPRPRPR